MKGEHSAEKRTKFIRNYVETARLPWDMHPLIWQRMFENFHKNGVQTGSIKNAALQNETENSMDGATRKNYENDNRKNNFMEIRIRELEFLENIL